MKLVVMVAMPAAAGIMVLANPIMISLYNDPRQLTATILIILGAASFFVCFQLVTTAILQANGHERLVMISFLVGAVIKITLSYILVANPNIGILGSPIGTLVCYITISSMNVIILFAKIKDRPKLRYVFFKPVICCSAMAACAFVIYRLLHVFASGLFGGGRMAVTVFMSGAILLAVAVYGILIIATRTITTEDMKLVPKGEKLVKLLKIR
jgi:stage V sporulation protein B